MAKKIPEATSIGQIPNQAGVWNARIVEHGGKKYTATHKDPATSRLWLEDFPAGKDEAGRLIRGAWV